MVDEIKAHLEEIGEIATEMKNLNAQLRTLRERKKTLEKSVIDYLDSEELPAIKYKNTVVIAEQKDIKKRKKKKEKEADCITVLKDCGIDDPTTVYKKIQDAMSGDKELTTKLKMKTLKLQ